jgi:hypothetical protein
VSPNPDVVESLLAPDDEPEQEAKRACMVVPGRAASSAEIDERERAMLAYEKTEIFPMPFWDADTGDLDLNAADREQLASIGVSPLEYEIILLEERTERQSHD